MASRAVQPDDVSEVLESPDSDPSGEGGKIAWWAVLGVAFLFCSAAVGWGPGGAPPRGGGGGAGEAAVFVALTALFLYGEGYRALQLKYVPWVVGRARTLRSEGRTILRLLGPFYAMSLVGASRARLARAWGGVTAVVTAVFVVRAFPEPWRGITDLAVAAALAWGLVALLVEARSTL
ncbi:MAG: hypothetical protein PVI57_04705 [Gemmatimonadota bacterium]|jgi:hypothetical protein